MCAVLSFKSEFINTESERGMSPGLLDSLYCSECDLLLDTIDAFSCFSLFKLIAFMNMNDTQAEEVFLFYKMLEHCP